MAPSQECFSPCFTKTTINAAILAGNVETAPGSGFSGGYDHFPRLLEHWDTPSVTLLTLNTSFVCLFPSKIAIRPWTNIGIYHDPPLRQWNYDSNFDDPARLPPGTPFVQPAWTE